MQNSKLPLKIKKFTSTIILLSIVLIASVLRLYQLGTVPPSPDWDEAALGYNAYSIMQTGRDEYGKFMPIVLQSFDDYKPALYMYTIIPFIPVFGVDLVAVRLPSALFGILTVLATYFLVFELFKRKDLAYFSSLLLAISPWHIQFSRVAFETNMGLAFNVFGVLFFLKGLKKPWFLLLAAFFLGLNLSVYHSERVFTPLLVLGLIFIFWKQVFSLPKKFLAASVVIGMLTLLPLISYIATNNTALSRLKGVNIFSQKTFIRVEGEKRFLEDKANNNTLGLLFHNKWVWYSREMLGGYLSHFDLNWLFIQGDLPRHHAPSMGLLYLWELPFLLIGIYGLLFFKLPTKTKIVIFFWFLLAPFPASVTKDVPHAVRTLNFLPTFQVFIAIGLMTTFHFFRKNHESGIMNQGFRLGFYITFFLFTSFNIFFYLNQYFVQQNYFVSQDWQYGYKEAAAFVTEQGRSYDKIVVSDEVPLDQSYIFFLYYLQYSPSLYQATGDKHHFDKFEFRKVDWASEKKQPNILYIGRPDDFPTGTVLKTIRYLNGEPAIKIVQ